MHSMFRHNVVVAERPGTSDVLRVTDIKEQLERKIKEIAIATKHLNIAGRDYEGCSILRANSA